MISNDRLRDESDMNNEIQKNKFKIMKQTVK